MTHYTDLIIERIRQYGALVSVADQYSAHSRVSDEDKRLALLSEAEEVLDGLRGIIGASGIIGTSYTREDIDNATDIARVQGQIEEAP